MTSVAIKPDLRARPVGGLPGRVQPFAVHQDQQPRRIESTKPRPDAKRAVAHRA